MLALFSVAVTEVEARASPTMDAPAVDNGSVDDSRAVLPFAILERYVCVFKEE